MASIPDPILSDGRKFQLAMQSTGRLGADIVSISIPVIALLLAVIIGSAYGYTLPTWLTRGAAALGVLFLAACIVRLWWQRAAMLVLRGLAYGGAIALEMVETRREQAHLLVENAELRRRLAEYEVR